MGRMNRQEARVRRKPKGRRVDGILLLDKPSGIRSNEALQRAKHLFKARKAGHTGSLDRLASGLLPICFGEATKLSAFLLDSSKRYVAQIRLGITTTTGDSDGEVRDQRPVPPFDDTLLEQITSQFCGEIEQIPPMYSALKVNGTRLYELAYKGVEIERKPRPVTIHELKVVALSQDTLEAHVYCSKGTYIRTLAEDFGEALGCGAHVVSLRRTAVGPFPDHRMVTLETLEALHGDDQLDVADSYLLPVDAACDGWPSLDLNEDMARFVRKGNPVLVPKSPTQGWVRLYGSAQEFVGVGEILDDGRVAPRRILQLGAR